MKNFELPGDQYFVRRVPGTTKVLLNGEAGLVHFDLRDETLHAMPLPKGFEDLGGAVSNVMFSADGQNIMLTDDNLGLCWAYDGGQWGAPASSPNANTLTDLCYLWTDRLVVRKNFGTLYYRWLQQAASSTASGGFERCTAISVRRDYGQWLKAIESVPAMSCHIHRCWQDTADFAYHFYGDGRHEVGYVSWLDTDAAWAHQLASPVLRLAALPDHIFCLVDGADGVTNILVIDRNYVRPITPPDGFRFIDVETVAHKAWTGLLAIAVPLQGGSDTLIAWPFEGYQSS